MPPGPCSVAWTSALLGASRRMRLGGERRGVGFRWAQRSSVRFCSLGNVFFLVEKVGRKVVSFVGASVGDVLFENVFRKWSSVFYRFEISAYNNSTTTYHGVLLGLVSV